MAGMTVEGLRERLRAAVRRSRLRAYEAEVMDAARVTVALFHPPPEQLDVESERYAHLDLVEKIDAAQADADRRVLERLPPGASRFGGVPDLPPGVEWPEFGGKKLPFLAQIDFSGMPRWEGDPLPEDGWLYLFFALVEEEYQVAAMHLRGERETLVRAPRPRKTEVWQGPNEPGIHELLPLEGSLALSLEETQLHEALRRRGVGGQPQRGEARPGCLTIVRTLLNLRREWGLVTEVEKLVREARSPEADEAERRSAGYLLGTVAGVFGTPESLAEEEGQEGDDWMLLLTIESVGSMEWSDAGLFYLLIRRQDLAAGEFSRVCAAVRSG